jgi:hypothetical protein
MALPPARGHEDLASVRSRSRCRDSESDLKAHRGRLTCLLAGRLHDCREPMQERAVYRNSA